jgi:hypothetical protein
VHRKALWFQHRDGLIARWGPVELLRGWYDYEANEAQREVFDSSATPNVFRTYKREEDDAD